MRHPVLRLSHRRRVPLHHHLAAAPPQVQERARPRSPRQMRHPVLRLSHRRRVPLHHHLAAAPPQVQERAWPRLPRQTRHPVRKLPLRLRLLAPLIVYCLHHRPVFRRPLVLVLAAVLRRYINTHEHPMMGDPNGHPSSGAAISAVITVQLFKGNQGRRKSDTAVSL